jgi:multicomponent Na+:H+ antiporter subunit D
MSGVMVELGVYGVARVHRVVFSATLDPAVPERTFVPMGVLTALVGAVMCVEQRHLKRLLAYSTIAHVGLFLTALGVGDAGAVAGVALYVAGHAGVKAALFLLSGLLLNRFRSVDEGGLYGRGRRDPSGWLFLLAGLALAGLPPFGPGLGKAVLEEASTVRHPWLLVVFVLVSAATGGAVLRIGVRIYLGRGHRPAGPEPAQISGADEEPEGGRGLSDTPATMLTAVVLLLAGGLAVGLVPPLARAAGHGAALFVDRDGYLSQVLSGADGHVPPVPPGIGWTASGVLLGLLSTAAAVVVAALALSDRRTHAVVDRIRPAVLLLRRLHSGHVGDYVAWLVVGVALLAALAGLPVP